MKTPSFIYFDLGNVLLNFSHELACQQMAAVAGVSIDDVRRFAFRSDMAEQYERGEIATREFYDYFCSKTHTSPDFDALLTAGSDIFHINAPILPIVSQLIERGVRIGILSNTCDMHWKWITQTQYGLLPRHFWPVVLSFEVGAIKPDRAIYLAAAEQAGVAPEEIFYTDDVAGHIDGARDAGFDAALFTSASKLAGDLERRGIRLSL